MPLRQHLSPDQKFAAICASFLALLGAEAALLYSLSQKSAPPPKIAVAPTPAPAATNAPLLFTAPKSDTPVPLVASNSATTSNLRPVVPVGKGAATPIPGATLTPAQLATQAARVAFEKGSAALQAKDVNTALAAFSQAARLAPENLPTRLSLAQIYEAKNDPKNALAQLQIAARLDRKNAAVFFSKARAELALNRQNEGLASLRQTLKLAPRERPARALLAQALVSGKRPTRAQIRESYAIWKSLADEDKKDVGAHLQAATLGVNGLGQTREAQTLLRRAIATVPRDPRPSLLLAELLVAQKQPKEAVRILETAAKNQPKDFQIYSALADARSNSGDAKGATLALRTALLRLPPAKSEREKVGRAQVEGGLRLNLGRALGESKQPQAALSEFQRVSILFPQSAEPDSLGAVALLQLKRTKDAAQSLERALKKEPKRAGDRRLLAQVYADLKQWDKSGAQWALYSRAQPKDLQALAIWSQVAAQQKDEKTQMLIAQKMTQAAPKNPQVWAQLGLLHRQKGDKRAALAAFETLGKLRPNEPNAAFERARLQGELGNSAGELREWKTVLIARPDFKDGYPKLLASAQKTGEAQNVRAFLVRVLAKKPENLSALSEILKFYEKAGRTDEAKAFLNDLVARDPKQKAAAEILKSFETAKAAPAVAPKN